MKQCLLENRGKYKIKSNSAEPESFLNFDENILFYLLGCYSLNSKEGQIFSTASLNSFLKVLFLR